VKPAITSIRMPVPAPSRKRSVLTARPTPITAPVSSVGVFDDTFYLTNGKAVLRIGGIEAGDGWCDDTIEQVIEEQLDLLDDSDPDDEEYFEEEVEITFGKRKDFD
jgi:hypothetical protein